MPNNSNARQKKKDKKKKTDSLPLHKEDKASMDSSSLLSPFLLQERMKPAWIEALFLL
jgi:hypothetical protein